MRRFAVGVIEWRILGFLKMKEGTSANEICQTLAIDKAAASRALKALEEKGLVNIGQIDRRQRSLSLTPKGRGLHDRILPIALEREQILLGPLSAAERQSLIALLRKLRSSLGGLSDTSDA
jgi:DNA-binding MarR family transcriptional regulator